jgi:hypothetical protein
MARTFLAALATGGNIFGGMALFTLYGIPTSSTIQAIDFSWLHADAG